MRILPYITDMRVKSLASALGASALLLVLPMSAFGQNASPAMTGTITGPNSATVKQTVLFTVTGRDQDTNFEKGITWTDPETGEEHVLVPPRFVVFNNYDHNQAIITLNTQSFELGELVLWTHQQNEADGQKRYQLSVKVAPTVLVQGIGILDITYRDYVHALSPFKDSDIYLTYQVIVNPEP